MKRTFATGLIFLVFLAPVFAAEKPKAAEKPAAATAKSATPAANKPANPAKTAKSATGEVDVKEGLDIIGSQDAPLELNIVPWKDKENYLPKNALEASVLNESLDPVDREVIRREVDFSRALQSAPTP